MGLGGSFFFKYQSEMPMIVQILSHGDRPLLMSRDMLFPPRASNVRWYLLVINHKRLVQSLRLSLNEYLLKLRHMLYFAT